MPIANDSERRETVRRILEREGANEELILRHLDALEESSTDPARRRWYTMEFNRMVQEAVPLDEVPDSAAWESYRESLVVNRLRLAGVPADFLPMTFDLVIYRPEVRGFDAAVGTCRDFAANITDRLEAGAGLTLLGNSGNGKSMLAALIERSAAEVKARCLFVRVRWMLDRLKDWDNADALRNDLEGVDLLVLDDLGAEYSSEWSRAEVDAVISARHADRRSIIVTSNLAPGELAKAYSPRILDRLRERGPALEIRGASWRRNR